MGLPDEARARQGDPWTSHAAARSIPPDKLRASQRAVLQCFETAGPMHHERLVKVYTARQEAGGWPMQSVSGLRTRTHELVEAGYLRNSGKVVVLPSRRKSIVWEVNSRPEPPTLAPATVAPSPHAPAAQLGFLEEGA